MARCHAGVSVVFLTCCCKYVLANKLIINSSQFNLSHNEKLIPGMLVEESCQALGNWCTLVACCRLAGRLLAGRLIDGK